MLLGGTIPFLKDQTLFDSKSVFKQKWLLFSARCMRKFQVKDFIFVLFNFYLNEDEAISRGFLTLLELVLVRQ